MVQRFCAFKHLPIRKHPDSSRVKSFLAHVALACCFPISHNDGHSVFPIYKELYKRKNMHSGFHRNDSARVPARRLEDKHPSLRKIGPLMTFNFGKRAIKDL